MSDLLQLALACALYVAACSAWLLWVGYRRAPRPQARVSPRKPSATLPGGISYGLIDEHGQPRVRPVTLGGKEIFLERHE